MLSPPRGVAAFVSAVAMASLLASRPASAHDADYRAARDAAFLWAEASLAATLRASPTTTSRGPSLVVVDGDLAATPPWIPVDFHLRVGADWRNYGVLSTSGVHFGAALGVHFGMLLSSVAGWGWISDPYFSPLNPTAGFTLDLYDLGNATQPAAGVYVANTMHFGCYIGVRMSVEAPYTSGNGVATTFGIALVVAQRSVWDGAGVGCGGWREYLERSAHTSAR